ncbi:MAG: MarR family transcriptional regulator [Acidimicrobiia bacterium]|nr:MarR family transcriptional regulator [Acidimicrobiia bacterium]
MAEKLDERRTAAWRAFLASHAALVGRLGEELQEEKGLPLPWYEVLLWLGQAPEGRLRMGELAGSLLLTPSGVTRLVDRMEADGLVKREQCPSDRRGWNAVITAAGRSRLRSAAPVHLRGIEQHFGRHLSDDEADVLADVLSRVLQDVHPDAAARVCGVGEAEPAKAR